MDHSQSVTDGAHTKSMVQPVHESAKSVSPTANRKVTVTGGAGPYIEIQTDPSDARTNLGAYLSRADARRLGNALLRAAEDARPLD